MIESRRTLNFVREVHEPTQMLLSQTQRNGHERVPFYTYLTSRVVETTESQETAPICTTGVGKRESVCMRAKERERDKERKKKEQE
jgi:hypothetical protein